MDRQPKLLILYASAGHGHEKAARAAAEACRELMPEADVELADTIKLSPGPCGNLYKEFYLFQIRRAPWLWGFFYFSLDLSAVYALARPFRRLLNGLTCGKLEHLLIAENPDVILTTHFQSSEVASHLKGRGKITSKIFTIVTDYLPHHIWTAEHTDRYLVAIPETGEALVRRGVSPDKISVTGIPIEKKFTTIWDREELYSKYGVEKGIFTVLLTSGGAGIGSVARIAEGLTAPGRKIQVLIVCGTNKVLEAELRKRAEKNPLLKVYGFVDYMDRLMELSDVIVGKAGGLTVTESLAKGKPIILFESIPGQETRNVECVEKYGAGRAAASPEEAVKLIAAFLEDPHRLDKMKEGVARMVRKESAPQIAALAEAVIKQK